MKLLLDTHTAIWWINERKKLSPKVDAMLLDGANTRYLSIASAWEIAIKTSIGKFGGFAGGVEAFLAKMEEIPLSILPIAPRHLKIVETLPLIHRDPFDRLLVATAKAEGMTILTADENIGRYEAPSLW